MPNYVTNRLTITGPNAEQIILRHCAKDEKGNYETDSNTGDKRFDFNTVIEMPKSLDIVSGGPTDDCMRLFINGMLEGCEDYEKYADIYRKIQSSKRFNAFSTPAKMTEDEFHNRIGRVMAAHDDPEREPYFRTKADLFAYGKQALDNFVKYGCIDWYDWCVKNWGTKWNACNTMIHGSEVWFETAWSPAIPIVKKLAELYPDCNFLLEYADEERGVLVGWIDIDNEKKEITENLYENFSKEAYEQAFMLLGGREDYEYNEKTGTYDSID